MANDQMIQRYSGKERVFGKAELEALLGLKGFEILSGTDDEGEAVTFAVKGGDTIIGELEENEVNGSWEIICYEPVSLAAFEALMVEDLIIWAWDDNIEALAEMVLSLAENRN